MHNEDVIEGIDFVVPKGDSQMIKVIGVGGGGGNAVSYMYKQGITGVSFVLCNTDSQALNSSPIRNTIQLGTGLGAGNNPEVAREAAEASREEIEKIFDANTKMVFVTATMGGGTGTGAAPVIARIAKESGVLTVGIVTIPFAWELGRKMKQAYKGVIEMRKSVDALLVIENEKLREVYPTLTIPVAFEQVNEVLNQAAKGIAELVTLHGNINLDFADVNTTLRNGGYALMNTGYGEGEHRIKTALENAVNSPLIQDKNVKKAKKILLNVCCPGNISMDETSDIDEFFKERLSDEVEVIWGLSFDEELGKRVKISVIVTGFGSEIIPSLEEIERGEEVEIPSKKQHTPVLLSELDDEIRLEEVLSIPAFNR